jgi:hypothetical protein
LPNSKRLHDPEQQGFWTTQKGADQAQVLGGAALPEHLNAAAKAEVIAVFHRIDGPGERRQCCKCSGRLSRANHNDLGGH